MKYNIRVFFLIICFAVSHYVNGQVNSSNYSPEHVISGKIRIKLNRENYINKSRTKALPLNSISSFGVKSVDDLNEDFGITRIERVFPFSLKDESKHREYGLDLWYELTYDSGDPKELADQYSILSEVDIAKPVYKKIRLDGNQKSRVIKVDSLWSVQNGIGTLSTTAQTKSEITFNDPLLSKQWHYENDGQMGDKDIDLALAWTRSTGSSDVIVAIVDGGIDVDHEDLADNMWINQAELNGEKGVDDDGNGFVDDVHGYNFVSGGAISTHSHGTHVAGTVGAVTNNNLGVAGVAGGDGTGNGVRLMSCQVFNDNSSGNFAAGVVYGADNGAVISQNSWGYTLAGFYEPEILDAIRYFIAEAGNYEGSPMKGGVVLVAAGNNAAEEMHYPAAFDEVIAVTSTGPDGNPSPFSNRGDWTDIAAPGGDMTNFDTEGGIFSTLPNNAYGYMQGTSMACPHVSGVAALVVAKNAGADFTAAELKNTLLTSATSFTFLDKGKYGNGNLNAARALEDNNHIKPDQITDLVINKAYHDAFEFGWTVPVDEDNGSPSYFYLALSNDEITSQNFNGQTVFRLSNNFEAGRKVSVKLSGLIKNTDYYFAVKSADRYENISIISNVISGRTTDEPHFMVSKNSVSFDIDITDEAVKSESLTLSNIGEGIVSWSNYVINEKIYFEKQEELLSQIEEKANAAVEIQQSNLSSSLPDVKPMALSNTSESTYGNYWDNDNTVYKFGMSYEIDNTFSLIIKSKNPNAGLMTATRFNVEMESKINVTHIEAALYLTSNENPVLIELRKGSKRVEDAETVYVQEYYPAEVGTFQYHRIPLYYPQLFEDAEVLWVVFHFPKEETYPQGCQWAYGMSGYFLSSTDNGNEWYDLQNTTQKPLLPMLRVLSSGDDGSYVFLDPDQGDISSKESQDVNLIVDAHGLSNGKHIASLNLASNDINKPIINVEVLVNVTGQVPEIDLSETQSFDIYADIENSLKLEIENTGLDIFEVYDISSNDPDFQKNFTNTIQIKIDKSGQIPFVYTTTSLGIKQFNAQLSTNVGEVSVSIKTNCSESPVLEMSLDRNEIFLKEAGKDEVELTLKNTGTSENLKFDLEHYNVSNLNKSILSEKLRYRVITSNESDDVAANQWDDISEKGSFYSFRYSWLDIIDMEMNFPFFEGIFTQAFHQSGVLAVNGGGSFAAEYNQTLGAFVPMLVSNAPHGIRTTELLVYSFGDRAVFSFTRCMNLFTVGEEKQYYSYQVVLFRNGAIEYRYKDIDCITDDLDYRVGLQGLIASDFMPYKELGETDKRVSNGFVIRYEPISTLSLIKNATPRSGFLMPGDSIKVKLEIDPLAYGVYDGVYDNNVIVNSNTKSGADTIPLRIHIAGTPLFEVEDSLKFDQVRTGDSALKVLKVSNTGNGIGAISSVSIHNPVFTVENLLPLSINPDAHNMLSVRFSPSVIGEVSANMTIEMDNGQSFDVLLIASSKADPNYTLNIQSDINLNVIGGENVRIPFTITTEDAGSDLEYSFTNTVFGNVLAVNSQAEGGDNEELITSDYIWEVSDSTKDFHKWNDISEDCVLLDVVVGTPPAIKLPFGLPFYGQVYDTLWVSRNGYVSVIKPEDDTSINFFEKGDGFRGMIAPLWSDMKPSKPDGGVKYKEESDRVYFQWDKFIGRQTSRTGGAVTFQLEIVSDGSIYFHYKDVNDYLGILIYGLESPDEEEILFKPISESVDWADFADSTTIAIAAPLRNTIATGQIKDFELLVSAERIYKKGTYRDTIELKTNSVVHPSERIPYTVNVTGSPVLSTISSLVWEDVIFGDKAVLKQKVKIMNTGYDLLTIEKFGFENLDVLNLYDESGDEIVTNQTGTLLKKIQLEPWKTCLIEVEIPVNQKENIDGSISINGNFETHIISVNATFIDSPVFNWTATDSEFSLSNFQTEDYSFTISNEGSTTLNYSLTVGATPSGDSEIAPGIVDERGSFVSESPRVVDSVHLDTKDVADGIWGPQIEGMTYGFSNKFVAPEQGFYMTHVKSYTNLSQPGTTVRIMVTKGGESPMEGELLYQQDYTVDKAVTGQWVYFPLATPFQISAGETFFVTVLPPLDIYTLKFHGYEISTDQSLLENSFIGGRTNPLDPFIWGNSAEEEITFIWKIRALTSSETGNWIDLDKNEGELASGEETVITATILAENAGPGYNKARIFASSNDAYSSQAKVDFTVNVNAAPQFKFRPNQYQKTIELTETEELTLNYLFDDLDGDKVTISSSAAYDEFRFKLTQTGETTAQVEFSTDYESSGVYNIPVQIKDEVGSTVHDTLAIEILDKNRTPVLNPEYDMFTLNLADPDGISIDVNDLFTDSDGDDLTILAGNNTPDIVDMALGYNYIDLHPLQAGTGFVIFGADDGKENGYILYGIYVQVIDDPDAIGADTDALDTGDSTFEVPDQSLLVYPNFVTNQTSTVQINIEEQSDVQIEIYNLSGHKLHEIHEKSLSGGIHHYQVDFAQYAAGIYICRFTVNGEFIQTQKIVVN